MGFRKRLIILVPLLAGVVALLVAWPRAIVERSDPYVRLVHRAIASYRTEVGRDPVSLTELERYLPGAAVSPLKDGISLIRLSADGEVVCLEARYMTDSEGAMEDLYVSVADCH